MKLFHSYIYSSIANRKSSQLIIVIIIFYFIADKLNTYVLFGKEKKVAKKTRRDTNQ